MSIDVKTSTGVSPQATDVHEFDLDLDALHEADLQDDDLLAERPISGIAPVAKSSARKALTDRLVALGHSQGHAEVIAQAVVDPTAVRASLNTPIRRRVRGGTLLCVDAQVWPPAICPSPTNPRGFADLAYPAGFAPTDSGRRAPLTSMRTDPVDPSGLLLDVLDQAQLVEAISDAITMVVSTNDLKDTVGREGVLAPLLLVPVRVQHQDDAVSDIYLLIAADGSSRTVATWRHWDLDESAVYRHATDSRALRQRMGQITTLLDKDRASLAAADLARLRVAQIPALIIIGYQPDEQAAGGVDLHQAVMSAVSLVHVDPPQAWAAGSDLDVKATAVLEEFTRRGILTPRRAEWMAGMLTPDEAEGEGFSHYPEVRAAAIFHTLGNDRISSVLNSGLRRLAGRDIRPRREKRLEVVCELMIRPHRRALGANQEKSFRNVLHRVLQYPGFGDYWRVTARSPEQLQEAAFAELGRGGPGAAARELGLLGAFYLAMYGALRRSGSNTVDFREPAQLLRDMLVKPHGIVQLAQAVRDGRARVQPRAVREDGSVIETATMTDKDVDDAWLRDNFPNTVTGTSAATVQGTAGDVPGPGAEFVRARDALKTAVATLESALREIRAPLGSHSRPIVEEQGLAPAFVGELVTALQNATMTLGNYKFVYEARRGTDTARTDGADFDDPSSEVRDAVDYDAGSGEDNDVRSGAA